MHMLLGLFRWSSQCLHIPALPEYSLPGLEARWLINKDGHLNWWIWVRRASGPGAKAYPLCGTPEYLALKSSCKLATISQWTWGVLYEMVVSRPALSTIHLIISIRRFSMRMWSSLRGSMKAEEDLWSSCSLRMRLRVFVNRQRKDIVSSLAGSKTTRGEASDQLKLRGPIC